MEFDDFWREVGLRAVGQRNQNRVLPADGVTEEKVRIDQIYAQEKSEGREPGEKERQVQ